MKPAAIGYVSLNNAMPPDNELGVSEVLGESRYEVRFAVVPGIGHRLVWNRHAWIVTDVVFNALRGDDGSLTVEHAEVKFGRAKEAEALAGEYGGQIQALVFPEQFLRGEDGAYPGDLRTFTRLPCVGEYWIDTRGTPSPRYIVRQVTHMLGALPEVVVGLDPNWEPRELRQPD